MEGKQPECSYNTSCFRKDPNHFKLLAHPHLDKLLAKQDDGDATLPDKLGFPCGNRALLQEQLVILRAAKQNNSNGQSSQQNIDDKSDRISKKVPECKWGIKCFRKLPAHFRENAHPYLEKLLTNVSANDKIVPNNLDPSHPDPILLQEQLEILRRIKKKTNEDEASCSKNNDTSLEDPDIKILEVRKSIHKRKRSNGETSGDNIGDSSFAVTQNKTDFKRKKVEKAMVHVMEQQLLKKREAVIGKMREIGDGPDYIAPVGEFALKWALADPFYMFFTTVQKTRATWNMKNSVTLSEILDRSFGDIDGSLHLSMVVDIGWLYAQYMLACQDTTREMAIFYGQIPEIPNLPNTCKTYLVKCPSNFGSHHAKISVFRYKDQGIRIMISSANLFRDDWEYRSQGVWISPHLPRTSESAISTDFDSPTGFKKDFLSFLSHYDKNMEKWRQIISRADFSSINVFFVGSVPGTFSHTSDLWGHKKLGTVLHDHVVIPKNEPRTCIIGQASSIGSLGKNYDSWIGSQIGASMSKTKESPYKTISPEFKFIYPTIDNYRDSHDMQYLVNVLFNSCQSKQEWFTEHMQVWKANRWERTRAVPHIKSYTRVSADNKRAWWFVLGSANLSKAAWGNKFGGQYQILSYEANIVFLPKFVTGENVFVLNEDSSRSGPTFSLPFDLPLTPYSPTDRPFTNDFFND